MELPEEQKRNFYRGALAFIIVLTLFFAVKFLSEVRDYTRSGSGTNTITISGHGEVQAVPDIATIYFTIRQEGKTVKEAQDKVAVIEAKVLEHLRQSKIEDKDIRTESASFNPEYEYETRPSPGIYPPMPGKQVVVGYEAYESISLKVRNTDDAGKIIEGLGTLGVTELSGPNFTLDDEDALKREARKRAIEDARMKAKALAEDLGVRLGRIASFNESGGYPVPLFGRAELQALDAAAPPKAAELPPGENTITSDVTITYEIR